MELSREAVRGAIDHSIDKRDDELSAYLQHQMVVPKLCLTIAVMEQLGITTLTYQPACGSCAGLLVHDQFCGGSTAELVDSYWTLSDLAVTDSAARMRNPGKTQESRV